MPIYAYRCLQCGENEDHIQRFDDPPVEECAACGGRLEKLIAPAAFHLKGGGWYKDGYASAKPSEAKSGEAKSGDSGSSKKSDTGSKAAAE